MIRAVVRDIESSDVDFASYRPEDPDHAAVHLALHVGPHNGPGDELFYVTACTPAWLASEIERIGPMIGRHLMIFGSYEQRTVEAFIRRRVEDIWGQSWEEVAEKVARIGAWEFEDYKPA